jgi:hypothetical protein
MMNAELLIQNGDIVYVPIVEDGIEYTTQRAGVPAKLTFKVYQDGKLKIGEGNIVSFRWGGQNVFYGYIFSISSTNEKMLTITAYDQTRYFKNKETKVYENKTATKVISEALADSGSFKVGTLEDTGYPIESRVEDTQTLFDIFQNALDETVMNTKKMYVLYDSYGEIMLKSLDNMVVGIVVDADTAESYDYTSSIDEQTYNYIKLYFDNEETGQRDVYIRKDSEKIAEWGRLQLTEPLQKGEDGETKADVLLELYNKKTRKLSIKNIIGDVRVRAGSMIFVSLALWDMKVETMMLVETCKHSFNDNEHFMDITVRGGEFIS